VSRLLLASLAVSLGAAGCAAWTSQDAGDVQTACGLTANAEEHLAAMDAGVGARVEVKTAKEILQNTLRHHKIALDGGCGP
jgi:hypothetical protein